LIVFTNISSKNPPKKACQEAKEKEKKIEKNKEFRGAGHGNFTPLG
jgi:hypothetical protein